MNRAALMRRLVISSGSNSDVSSEDDTSDVSDLDKFEEAYTDFSGLTAAWTHLPWSVMAQVIQMMMSLDLTCQCSQVVAACKIDYPA